LLTKARPWIGGVWWYELSDDGPNPTDAEQRFGLLRQSGERKQGYNGLLQITDILRSPKAATERSGPNGSLIVEGELSDHTRYFSVWLPTDNFRTTAQSAEVKERLHDGFSGKVNPGPESISPIPSILLKR